MIGYFPEAMPDELWYSACARFTDRMSFGTETGPMLALHGSRYAVASVDLPLRLCATLSQLPAGHPCTVDTVIDCHTLLPFYGPFLLTTRYQEVRRYMEDGSKSSARVRCGACTNRVRPPKFFRSCPECDRLNREKFGETHWRRLFQLPGVEVCPIHAIFLEPSDLRLDPLSDRHTYRSAESRHLGTMVHSIDRQDPNHQSLLNLANDSDWLLGQEHLNPGLDFIKRRYREVLTENGYATRIGSVRMDDLRRHVVGFYGPSLLDSLQCGLPPESGDGWLGNLLRKANTAAAPLRHLLLLRALGVGLERFFFPKRFTKTSTGVSNPSGPWACLNPVCVRHGEFSISRAEEQPADRNGANHLAVRCPHCGFAYQVKNGEEAPTRANRVIDYGPIWTDTLKKKWADSKFTLRQIASALGTDPKTIKNWAAKLGLRFPRAGKRPVTRRGLYVPQRRDRESSIQIHRKAWVDLRRQMPKAGTKEIRSRAPGVYAWLYRNDRSWLEQHRPRRLPPAVTLVHVDWPKRDMELAGSIATAVHRLKNPHAKPQRVTITAIGRALGKQALFEAAMAKLPLTQSVIDGHVESLEDFAVRRVHMAAARLREAERVYPRWRLVRAAGLHHRLTLLPRVKSSLDLEMRPFVAVTVIPDSEPNLPEDIQAPDATPTPRLSRKLKAPGSNFAAGGS